MNYKVLKSKALKERYNRSTVYINANNKATITPNAENYPDLIQVHMKSTMNVRLMALFD